MGEVKDYVKNVESKDKLQSAVDRNKINDGFDFNKFDQEMEEHFNNFLESHKQEFTENTSRETIQAAFNDWLDNELIKVDDFKDNLIEVAIIGPTSFELQKFQTVSELGILQEKIIAEKEKTQKTEVVSVNGRDLHIDTYKDASGEKVDVNKIAGLFNENFERKDELLNLLKQGGIGNVKKFQRIIADLPEDGSEDAKGKNTLLGRFGVDGKFGGNTMKAFEDYISNNKKTTDNGTSAESGDSTETGASTGTGTSAETGSSTKTEASTESGTSAETGTSTESGDNETGQASADMTVTRTQAPITGNPAGDPEIVTKSVSQEAEGKWRIETQEMSLAPGELETKLNEELQKIATSLPEIRVLSDGNKYNLYIPKVLGDLRSFNVTHSPEMAQYIKVLPNTEGVECFVVPANIKIGLKKEMITNTLVLGDYEAGNSFIDLNSSSKVVGDPQRYSGDLSQASLKITELLLDEGNETVELNKNLQTFIRILDQYSLWCGGFARFTEKDGKKYIDAEKIMKTIGGGEDLISHNLLFQELKEDDSTFEGLGYREGKGKLEIGFFKNGKLNGYGLCAYGDQNNKRVCTGRFKDGEYFIGKMKKREKGNSSQSARTLEEEKEYSGWQKVYGNNSFVGNETIDDDQKHDEQKNAEHISDEQRNEYHNLEDEQYGEMSPEALATNYDAIIDYMEGKDNKNLIQAFQRLKINPNSIANTLGQILLDNPNVTKGKFTKEHISKEAMDQLGRNSKWFVNEKNELIKILNEVDTDKLKQFINEMKVFNDVRQLQKTKEFIRQNTNKIINRPFLVLSDFNKSGSVQRGQEGLMHEGRTSEQAMLDIFISLADTEVKGGNKEIIDGEKTADLVQGFVSMIKSLGEGRYENIEDEFAGKYTIENLGNYIIEHPETLVLYQQTLNTLSYNASIDIKDIVSHKRRQTIIDNGMQDVKEISTNRDAVQNRFNEQKDKDENLKEWFNGLSAKEKENFVGNMAIWLDKGGLLQSIVKTFGVSSKTGVTVDSLDDFELKRNFLKDDAGVGPRLSLCGALDVANIEHIRHTEYSSGATGTGKWLEVLKTRGLGVHLDIPIANLTIDKDVNRSSVENSVIHGVDPIYQFYTRLGANIGGGLTIGGNLVDDDMIAEFESEGEGGSDFLSRLCGHFSAAAELALGVKINYKKGIEVKSNRFGNVLQEQIFKDPDFSSKEGFIKKAKESVDKALQSTEKSDKNLKKFIKNNKEAILSCIDNVSALMNSLGAFDSTKKQEHKQILLNSIMKGIVEEVKNQNLGELNGKTHLTRQGVFGQIGASFNPATNEFGWFWSVGGETTISSWNMLYLPDKEKYEYMDAALKSGKSIRPLGEGIKTNNIENMKNTIAQALSENSIPNIKVEGNDKSQIEISVTDAVLGKYGKKNIYELFNIYVNPDKKDNVAISEDGKTLTIGGNNLENFSVATRRYFDDFAVYLMIGGKGIDGCANNKINDDTISEYNTAGHAEQVPGFKFKEYSDEYRETPYPLDNLFESYKELNSIFNDIEKKLSKMDDREFTNGRYGAFMNAAATEGIDDILDNLDYEEAFKNLKTLLEGKLKDTCFDGLRGKLSNATDQEKAMIIDRFKAIFSYNDQLTNAKSLNLQLQRRGSGYKELYGYDKSEIFPLTSGDYREAVRQKLNEKGSFTREPNPNLVGMTAFYRLGKNDAGRSYMMTELGGTNVLGGETIAITDTGDLERAQDWFTNNLDKSGVHKDLLIASLSTKLKSILNVEELAIPSEDLKPLLKGEYIDIGDKKVKINTKYVFYLLGECGNESIGVELGDITVKTKVERHEDEKDNVLEVGADGQTLTKTESLEQNDVSAKGGYGRTRKEHDVKDETRSHVNNGDPKPKPRSHPNASDDGGPIGGSDGPA